MGIISEFSNDRHPLIPIHLNDKLKFRKDYDDRLMRSFSCECRSAPLPSGRKVLDNEFQTGYIRWVMAMIIVSWI